MRMTHKSISIPEEIYSKLAALRYDDESIPDVLTRLIESSKRFKTDLPRSLKESTANELDRALERFKEDALTLPENWDDQGAKAFSENFWQEIREFLLLIHGTLYLEGQNIPFPLVLPNSDGSLDIDWETKEFELLINYPPDPVELIHIYGEKLGSPKNELDVRINRELASLVVIAWMKKIF